MNMYLQIGIGLLPAMLVIWKLMLVRKAFSIKNFFLILLVTGSTVGSVALGGIELFDHQEEAVLSQGEFMTFANALMAEGLYEQSEEVLEEYCEVYGYDDECRLLTARLYVAAEDYERANGIYQYLAANTNLIVDEEEINLTYEKASYDGSDLVHLQYLIDNDMDIESYGYTTTSYDEMDAAIKIEQDEILDEIIHSIEEEYQIEDSEFQQCARAIEDCLWAANYSNVVLDFEEVLDENEALGNTKCFREFLLEAYVENGNYERVAQLVNENSDYSTLMIAAELYMANLVRTSDFLDKYQGIDESTIELVEDKLEKVYEVAEDSLSNQEKNNLEDRIDSVILQLDNPVLLEIKEQLLEEVKTEEGADKTKIYLELGKTENYFNNQTLSDNYLKEAINSSQDSDDDVYAAAMADIISVINQEDNGENIKNVSSYVDTVLDHSLTIGVESTISNRALESPYIYEEEEEEKDLEDLFSLLEKESEEESEEESEDKSEEEIKTELVAFDQTIVEYVTRTMSAISIGKIDTENFAQITARVQISSDYISDIEELKDALRVYDCGIEIEEFTLEKIEYDEMNLLLCCDVSGSMDSAIWDLRSAVETFIVDKNEDENLSIVTFDSAIVDTKPFGSSDEELLSLAQTLGGGGGTNIYDTVKSCLEGYRADEDDNNIIILMTDGQDGDYRDIATIYSELGTLASEKGIIIYTLGLGESVDVNYLTNIAESGNGEFLYIADSVSLTSFYNLLHEQLANQYEITYEAVDTMTVSGRTLKVELESESTKDTKTYSIGDTIWDEDTEVTLEVTDNLSVTGLNVKYLYKGSQDVEVYLKGTGFDSSYPTSFLLDGNMNYAITMKYVDEETYSLTIPSYVSLGIYDADITINGQRIILQNEFTVVDEGELNTFEFGDYTFTSISSVENSNGSTTLSGIVRMNDWLWFKGDVSIWGEESDGSIYIEDNYGSYITYDVNNAEGLGLLYAENGINQEITALGGVTLYHDYNHEATSSDYNVDNIYTDALKVINVLRFDSPACNLYPYQFTVNFATATTIFPLQDKVIKNMTGNSIFEFKYDGSLIFTSKNVDLKMELEYKDGDESFLSQIDFFNVPTDFNGSVKVEIDTLKNDYLFGAMISLPAFGEGGGFGGEIAWKNGLFDSVEITVDLNSSLEQKFTYVVGGVPVTLTKFSLGASDIGTAVESGNLLSIVGSGSVGVAAGKVSAIMPALEPFVGNISVFSLPETKVEFRLSPFTIEAETKLMLFSEIQLLEAKLSIGTFKYTNSLFAMYNEEVAGFSASLEQGIEWKPSGDRINLEISGTGSVDIHSRFIGTTYTGTGIVEISWWFLDHQLSQTGTVSVGFYTSTSDKKYFVIGLQAAGTKANEKILYYIDEDGDMGDSSGTLR